MAARKEKSLLPFEFYDLNQLRKEIDKLGINLPLEKNFEKSAEILAAKCYFRGRNIPNSLCIQPMEGCDGESDGRPGELTFRRYRRFAAGGAGIIWVEATAVTPEGRANPRQLWINEKSVSGFRELVERIKENALDFRGGKQVPYLVLQLTHSGRYSKPSGYPSPIIAYRSPVLKHQENEKTKIITDAELDELKVKYVAAAQMAEECGFDAVDIKTCHGYLSHELLSACKRRDSKYGGSFENRTRFLRETVETVKKHISSADVTSRLNVYDGIPYPYGWGMKKDGSLHPDMEEPMKLLELLQYSGVTMINIAVGNPYYNPHLERPYDYPVDGGYISHEHPLNTIARIIGLTYQIAEKFPSMFLINTGFSWLRHFSPLVGAKMKEDGKIESFGLGRLALACPDFANRLFRDKYLPTEKMCISCSSCSQIMRDGERTGCVVRDMDIYGSIYRNGRLNNTAYLRKQSENCLQCWEGSCKEGCPADIDIRKFVDYFGLEDYRKSYEVLRRKNPLPEITSYVCPVEVLCEKNCLAGTWQGEPIPVHRIQRKVAETARENGWTSVRAGKARKEKIAVIGGGPAGLSATVYLVEIGYKVVLFEAGRKLGGMLNIIPALRLPAEIVEKEISGLSLERNGKVKIEYGRRLFADFSLEDLFEQNFSAVLLATGLEESGSLPMEKPKGVIAALDFLSHRQKNGAVSPAAVIGGGNLAMDAAAALKDEGHEVYLIYRRGKQEMPAWPAEKKDVEDKGVHFMVLSQPVEYIADRQGNIEGIKIIHTRLAGKDRYGRKKPENIPGTEHVLPVRFCIEAVGQSLCKSISSNIKCAAGGIRILSGSHATDIERVFAAGDAVNGGDTVIKAVAEGRDAAYEISDFLKKKKG